MRRPYIQLLISLILASTNLHAQGRDAEVDSLIDAFERQQGALHVETANHLLSTLVERGFGDEPVMTTAMPTDTVDMTVYYYAAEYALFMRDCDLCIRLATAALPLTKNNDDYTWQSETCNLLSQAWFYKSNYVEALRYAEQGYEVDSRHKDYDRMGSTLNTMAAIYLAAHMPEQACHYSEKAIEADAHTPGHPHASAIYGVASEVYQSLDRFDRALQCATTAFQSDQARGDTRGAAIRLSQMAAAHLAMADTARAHQLLDQCIPVLERHSVMPSLGISLNTLGEVWLLEDSLDRAAQAFARANDLLGSAGYLYNQARSLHGLFGALLSSHPDSARSYMRQYETLRDSIYRSEVRQNLAHYQARYQLSQLQQDVAQHDSRRRATIVVTVAILVVVVLLFTAFSWHQHRYMKRRLRELDRRQAADGDAQPEVVQPAHDDTQQQLSADDAAFIGRMTSVVCQLMNNSQADVDSVASAMNMSTSQLRRRVQTITGKSSASYILQIRLSNAQRLLDKSPELSMSDVAYRCGFSDQAHFSHAFKDAFGVSPTQWAHRAR